MWYIVPDGRKAGKVEKRQRETDRATVYMCCNRGDGFM